MSSNEDSNSKKDVTKLIKEASDVKKSNEELNKKADSLERGIKDMVGIMNNLPKFKINAPEQSTDSSNATRVNPTAGNTQYVDVNDLARKLGSQSQPVGNSPMFTFDLVGLSGQINQLSHDIGVLKGSQGYSRVELDLKLDLLTNTLKAYVDGLSATLYSKADVDNKFLTKSESASLEKKINDTVNNLVSDVKAYIDTVEDDLKSYIDGSRSARVSKTRTECEEIIADINRKTLENQQT